MKNKTRRKRRQFIIAALLLILALELVGVFVISKDDSVDEVDINKIKVASLDAAPRNNDEYQAMGDGEYATENGYILTIKDGVTYVDGLVIANKTFSLPDTYEPADSYVPNSDNHKDRIDKTTMEAFKQMEADAEGEGVDLYIISGYRSYYTQQSLFNRYCSQDGEAAADRYSARAGHSEHQTGYCFDLNSVEDSFADTKEGKWLDKNAYRYGFVIRYPKGKEDITGYKYEAWHLRYVGTELAKKLYNNGDWITVEEYYGLTSVY